MSDKRPTPIEIIDNMRHKGFREEIILEEVEKELRRLSLNPKEPEAVHGNEAEKEVCEHMELWKKDGKYTCLKCRQEIVLKCS